MGVINDDIVTNVYPIQQAKAELSLAARFVYCINFNRQLKNY